MLSVIIPTVDSARPLVPTLAALVPGAISGLVSEVLVADGGSRDDTAAIADAAGCRFLSVDGPLGRRIKTAAATARAPWLLFLRPGTVLDAPWTGEVGRFVGRFLPETGADRAAVFRRGGVPQAGLSNVLSLVSALLGVRPRPEQGLLIARQLYDALGGHAEDADDAERDLLRGVGRRRLVTLSTNAFTVR